MSDSFFGEIDSLGRALPALRDLVARAEAMTPERVEASDRTGTLSVVLGPDGLPESMLLAPDWHRTLGVEAFEAAVAEAAQSAHAQRAAMSAHAMDDSDWMSSVERIGRAVNEESRRTSTTTDQSTDLPTAADDHARPVPVPMQTILRAAEALDRAVLSSPPSVHGTGSAAFGKLTLTFSRNCALSCSADLDWLSRQESDELTEALNHALTSAKADLAASIPRLDQSLDDLIAVLRNPGSIPE